MDEQDGSKRLSVMTFWLFGTFVIVWSAVTAYIGLFTDGDWLAAVRAGAPIGGLTALMCLSEYVGYRIWIRRLWV